MNTLLANANKRGTTTLYFHNNDLKGGAQDDSYRYAGSDEMYIVSSDHSEYSSVDDLIKFSCDGETIPFMVLNSDGYGGSPGEYEELSKYCAYDTGYAYEYMDNQYFYLENHPENHYDITIYDAGCSYMDEYTIEYCNNGTRLWEEAYKKAAEQAIAEGYLNKYSINNYVCLDGGATSEGECGENDADLYRIIGLFKNENIEDEDYEKYEIKLIKYDYATMAQLGEEGASSKKAYSESTSYYKGNQENLASIGGYYWASSSNEVNEWAGSALRETNLNDYYLNTYLKEEKGIDTDNLITTHTWSLNGHSSWTVNPKVMYDNEMDKTKTTENKIGLMYISDYGYAASPRNTTNWSEKLDNYSGGSIPDNNWMYMGLYEWTISRESDTSSSTLYVDYRGDVGGYDGFVNSDAYSVRPCFYINSNAKIKSGDGTKSNPYRLSL